MNIKANGDRKLFLLAAIGLILFLFVYLLFDSRLQPPSIVVKAVRNARSGEKTICEALLCLTNGGRHEVIFQSGVNEGQSFITLMWFGVEKKQNGQWVLDFQSRQAAFIWDPHVFKPGKAVDFRAQFPADGQIRRLVVHWRPGPGKLSLLFTRMKQRWQKLASTKPIPAEKFYELRSAELLAEKSAEYEGAAFKSIAAPDYEPSTISNVTKPFREP